MGRLTPLLLAFALGAACAAALASCGGGGADLLPGTTADQIESNLDQVEELAAEEDCVGAEDAVATVTAEVEELQGVDAKLKAALREGTAKLSEVVARCDEESSGEAAEPEPETDVEAEVEEEKKPKKEKPEKEGKEPSEGEEPEEEEEGPSLPPQSKGEEKGKAEPPAEPEGEETPPSGGVGPNVGVE